MPKTAIQIKGLKKSYNKTPALRGVDIDISKGEFFGLLGPNGAGKTTTINILTGLVFKDAGTCLVFEKDIVKQMCGKFYDDKILSIIVEGGTKTLSNFIDSETWDEMRVLKTKEKLGDGIKAPNIKLEESKKIKIGDNELVCYENKGVTFSNI